MADYKDQAKTARSQKMETMGVQTAPERYDLTTPDGLKAAQDRMNSLGLSIKIGSSGERE